MDIRRFATRREAAERLRVTERTIDRWTRAGRLKTVRVGRLVRYELTDIDALASGW